MAWSENQRKSSAVRITSGLPSTSAVNSLIRNASQSNIFYELEMAEVLDLLLYEADLPALDDGTPDFSLLGAIKARMINSQNDVHIDALTWIIPINTNIKEYPLIGEHVIVGNYAGELYYFNKVNILNSINSNPFPGLSSMSSKIKTIDKAEVQATGIPNKTGAGSYKIGDIFKENQQIRQIQPHEGDIIFNGRFGNTIRLGSDIKNDNMDSPNIILRAGQLTDAKAFDIDTTTIEDTLFMPVEEDINADGSSIWITTKQEIKLEPSTKELIDQFYSTLSKPINTFEGKQIVLNSDRIIFNSKKEEIVGFAKKGIEFTTEKTFGIASARETIINSPTLLLGINELNKTTTIQTVEFLVDNVDGKSWINTKKIQLGTGEFEAAILGNTLKKLLEDFADIVMDFSKGLQKVGVPLGPKGTPIAPNVPSVPMIASPDMTPVFIQTITKIIKFKMDLRTALSTVVQVE